MRPILYTLIATLGSCATATAQGAPPPAISVPSYANTTTESSQWNLAAATAFDPSFWFSADYLVWYTRNQNSIPLVTSIPDSLVGSNSLTTDQITQLYPSKRKIEFDAQSGIRLSGGYKTQRGFGVDASFFSLASTSDGAFFSSGGSPSLSRSYTRALDGIRQDLYSAQPGQYGGFVRVFTDTQTFGGDANARIDWYRMFSDRNDLLLGGRYMQVDESLVINDRSDLDLGRTVNTVLDVARTRNRYYGTQLGFSSLFLNSRGWSIEVQTKFGIGSVRQEVQIFGQNTFGDLPVQKTGLYAGQFNSGRFARNQFAAAGEFGLNAGYNITANCRLTLGYNIAWLSSVVRPAQVFDGTVNDSQIRFVAEPPTDANNRRPSFDFGRSTSDFWVQGLNLGLSLAY